MPALALSNPPRSRPAAVRTFAAPACRIESALLALARAHGFYSGIYAHLGHGLGRAGAIRIAASSPVARRQFGDSLAAGSVARHAATALKPFAWSSGEGMEGLYDMYAGVAVPVQDHASGPALVALIGVDRDGAEAVVAECTPELMAAAADLHLAARADAALAGGRDLLTPRELECLRLAALGLTVSATGALLGVAGRTVEFHLKNIGEKLGASNKVHAVAIAAGRGLLQV